LCEFQPSEQANSSDSLIFLHSRTVKKLTHRIVISAESATHLLFPTNSRQFIVFLRELLQIFFPGAPIAPSGCHDIERVAEIAVLIGRAIVHILHNNLTPTLLS
jgi:hypothetical protein